MANQTGFASVSRRRPWPAVRVLVRRIKPNEASDQRGQKLDVLPRLKAKDSHIWRCTSASENVHSSVGISIMFDTTVTAGPRSYSQPRDTFRPRRAVFRPTRRTGLGRTAFVDFLERGSVRDRFVAELVSEGRPGRVVDAVRHPGSGELGSRHVADRDVIETPHQIERELVLEIGTGIRDLGVQLRDMPFVFSRPLRFRELLGRASTEPIVRQLLAGRKCDEVFQSEIAVIDVGSARNVWPHRIEDLVCPGDAGCSVGGRRPLGILMNA